MRWSTTGLENLLNILLTRYCNKQLYNKIKERYINQENRILMQITIIGEKVNRLRDGTKYFYSMFRCDVLKLVTVLLPEACLEGLNELVRANMYPSRSATIRAAVHDLLRREIWTRYKRHLFNSAFPLKF